MKELLPPELLKIIRDRYLAGVADAEATFEEHRADEDSVTGALGQSIAMPQPLTLETPNGLYHVRISQGSCLTFKHSATQEQMDNPNKAG